MNVYLLKFSGISHRKPTVMLTAWNRKPAPSLQEALLHTHPYATHIEELRPRREGRLYSYSDPRQCWNKSTMVTAKVWVLKRQLEGKPKLEDFSCIEEELPECKEGDVIVTAEYISVDPYIRYKLRSTPLNKAVTSGQVARVIESKNKDWPVGSRFVMYPGWRTHTYITKKELSVKQPDLGLMPLPDIGSQPASTALGVLGMPGNSAYFGFLEICQPQRGDTVLVNGAAGAVGSLVVQIAKIKGCKVIAFAGSDEKVAWVKEIGADYAYNYKTTKIAEALKEVAPLGINCYFDNVGGSFTGEVIPFMASMGRISVCGAISTYNREEQTSQSPYSEMVLITKQLRIEGFLVYRWLKRWHEGIRQMKEWVEEGKIKYRETETVGFEKTPSAFIGLFSGSNIGKAVIKV